MTEAERTMLVAKLYPHIEALREEIAKMNKDYDSLTTISLHFGELSTSMHIHEYAKPNNRNIDIVVTGVDFGATKITIEKPSYFDTDTNMVELEDDGYKE